MAATDEAIDRTDLGCALIAAAVASDRDPRRASPRVFAANLGLLFAALAGFEGDPDLTAALVAFTGGDRDRGAGANALVRAATTIERADVERQSRVAALVWLLRSAARDGGTSLATPGGVRAVFNATVAEDLLEPREALGVIAARCADPVLANRWRTTDTVDASKLAALLFGEAQLAAVGAGVVRAAYDALGAPKPDLLRRFNRWAVGQPSAAETEALRFDLTASAPATPWSDAPPVIAVTALAELRGVLNYGGGYVVPPLMRARDVLYRVAGGQMMGGFVIAAMLDPDNERRYVKADAAVMQVARDALGDDRALVSSTVARLERSGLEARRLASVLFFNDGSPVDFAAPHARELRQKRARPRATTSKSRR